MADMYCPTHPQTKLLYALRGGADYCVKCYQYVQAADVPEPKPAKAVGKSVKAKKKVRAKTR